MLPHRVFIEADASCRIFALVCCWAPVCPSGCLVGGRLLLRGPMFRLRIRDPTRARASGTMERFGTPPRGEAFDGPHRTRRSSNSPWRSTRLSLENAQNKMATFPCSAQQ
jgi:hypothetical protein